MKQTEYESIIKCIEHGAPALATDLVEALNNDIRLAMERTQELRDAEAAARAKAIEEQNKRKAAEPKKQEIKK